MFRKSSLYFCILILSFVSLSACSSKKSTGVRTEPMSESAVIQYQFAYEFYEKNDLIRALRSVLQAEELSPRSADVLNLKGLILFRQEKYDEAEAAFLSALDLDPKLSDVLNNLGTLYFQMKKLDQAEATLKRALDNPLYLYPERIHNNLGLVYFTQGKEDLAKLEFQRAIRVRSDFYLALQNLAKILIKEENYPEAKAYLEEAIQHCSNCSEPRYHLGTIYMKENNQAEALKLFREAHRVDPKGYYGQLGRQFLIDSKESR